MQVTANRLEYDGTAGLAKYIGAAKLWQDKTRIQGDAIDLDDHNAEPHRARSGRQCDVLR